MRDTGNQNKLILMMVLSTMSTCIFLAASINCSQSIAMDVAPQNNSTFSYDDFMREKRSELIAKNRVPNQGQQGALVRFFQSNSQINDGNKKQISQQIDGLKNNHQIVGEQAAALKTYIDSKLGTSAVLDFTPVRRDMSGYDKMRQSYQEIANQNDKIINDRANRGRLNYNVETTKVSYNQIPKLNGGTNTTTLELKDQDSVDAAKALILDGHKVALVNFANSITPGGGYLHGSLAQEEDICRRTTLYPALNNMKNSAYPIKHNELIYSSDIKIFRDSWKNNFALLPDPLPSISVVTIAAYNLNDKMTHNDLSIMAPGVYEEGTRDKIRAQLRIAADKGNDVIVLGAFGCGAFAGNNPQETAKIVSKLYKEVLEELEFQGVFEVIRFAILDQTSRNYTIFKDVLKTARVSKNTIV